MSTATMPAAPAAVSRLRVIATGLADMAIDLLLPTLVYLALAPTHLNVAIRLTLGGYVVAGKALTGERLSGPGGKGGQANAADLAPRAGRTTRLVLAAAGTAAACAATLASAAAGAGTTTSIVAGTLVVAISSVLLLRAGHRHLDSFALLVLAELGVSVTLTLISSDPRFVLARPAVYTTIAGIYVLATVRTRPFMMQVTRPIAAGGDPIRATAFDRAWTESARFRTAERAQTITLGIMLLAEAVLRVAIVYTQPEHAVLQASLLSQLPAIGLFLLWFLTARFIIVPIASKEVDALMPAGMTPPQHHE
jgi:hypothetical protein